MTYVEKRLILRNGPPWGFRLYEDFMEGLIVAKIRHRSPSEQAGLREGDHVLAINGVDALDMSHAQAVQIIDFASYTLEIIVGRYERHKNTETVYMDNKALLSKQKPQEITTTELQLFWEKEMPLKPARRNWPPPPQPVQEYNIPPQQTPVQSKRPPLKQTHSVSIHVPAQKPVAIPTPPQIQTVHIPPPVRQQSIDPPIIPHDPDVTSVSVKQLMREFDVPPIAPELKKKNYADSSFYSDPTKYYPTIEEQIEMARRVANSLHDPYNLESKGACMFEKQRQRAEKHVKEGPEPQPDPIELASPEELEYMAPPEAPPPPPPPPPSFPGLQPTKKPVIPSPPPMTFAPGQPKTVQEFLEKIKIFPKNLHTDLDPQKCFDIAAALYSSDSRGAKMFAKRHARAIKWDAQNTEDGDEPGNRMNVTVASGPGPTIRSHDQLKMVSKLPQSKTQQQLLMKQQQQQAPVNQSNNNSNNNNNNVNINGNNQGCLHSQRMNYNHHGCWDYYNNPSNRVCSGGGGSVETALAVNTEVSDQEFGLPPLTTATASTGTTIITGNMMDSLPFAGNMYMNANYDNHQRYSHPHSSSNNNNTSFRWDQSQQQQQQQPVSDYDRCMISIPNVSVPPLPSVFSMSTHNCLKFNNNNSSNNNNPPVYPMFNLQNLDSSRWFSSPLSSVTTTSPPTVGVPTSITTSNNPIHSTLNNSNNRFATIDNNQLIVGNNMNNNNLSLNQNPQYRRCLETLKLRQTRLAVALIRVSKSHIHRLDQIVQICNQNIHSAVSLLAISQQVFAEAVGWKLRSPVNRKPNNTNLLESAYSECGCLLNSNPPPGLILPTATNPTIESFYTRDRIFLISTAFHLALIVVLRTLSRSVHWRRREMLAWAVTTALHVGPPACLYLIYHWSSYVNPREAVSWLAPALLTAVGTLDVNTPTNVTSRMSKSLSTNKLCPNDQSNSSTIDNPMCFDHSSLFFGLSNWDDDSLNGGCTSSGLMMNMNPTPDTNYSICPTWYSFCPTSFTSRSHSHSIIVAAQLLNTAVPYSKASREQITNAVRHMALQAAAKDPINCSLPALNLSVKDPIAFDAIYRLVLNSAETGGLGPIQLFSLARYMDNCGWTWRAFPFALHATRLFVLSTTQESHPVGNDVLWACLLGHRLGPGALQEILNHVIRNIHCPTLLTDILHRCRSIPCGVHINSTNCNINMNNNNINGIDSSSSSSSMMMMNNNMTNSIPSVGRGNSCATHFCNPTPHYVNNNNNGTGVSGCTGKMLSLDRPPLKGLLDAAINGFVMATHMRLANISPRQYAEFVDFLTRARDTFHLLRPDGPLQFRSLVECLRQTYRGKRKLVSLLSERFG